MKNRPALITTSLLSILLFSIHWANDMVYGFAPGGLSGLFGIAILAVWLYGTLALADRLSGCIIMMLGGMLGVTALILHMRGAGIVGGRIANSSGELFWAWTLLALGGTSAVTALLAVRAMWSNTRERTS